MFEDFSPEEKLLRLIKGKQKPKQEEHKQETSDIQKQEPAPSAVEGPTPAKEKPIFVSNKRPQFSRPDLPAFSFKPVYIYAVLAVAGVIIFSIIISNIFSSKEDKEMKEIESLITSVPKETTPAIEPAKQKEPSKETSFEEYQKLIEQKNVFVAQQEKKQASGLGEISPLREISKNLRLVGIMPGSTPQAMIEDKRSSQTFFLKKGEFIEDIEIKDISDGKVILGYGSETVTLSL